MHDDGRADEISDIFGSGTNSIDIRRAPGEIRAFKEEEENIELNEIFIHVRALIDSSSQVSKINIKIKNIREFLETMRKLQEDKIEVDKTSFPISEGVCNSQEDYRQHKNYEENHMSFPEGTQCVVCEEKSHFDYGYQLKTLQFLHEDCVDQLIDEIETLLEKNKEIISKEGL